MLPQLCNLAAEFQKGKGSENQDQQVFAGCTTQPEHTSVFIFARMLDSGAVVSQLLCSATSKCTSMAELESRRDTERETENKIKRVGERERESKRIQLTKKDKEEANSRVRYEAIMLLNGVKGC